MPKKPAPKKKSTPKKAKAPKPRAISTFDLRKFFKRLDISQPEQAALTDCLTRGIKNYYRHIYGYDKYGQDVAWLIHERMYEPYIFGFGAVEVARQEALSLDTRLKVMDYTLQQTDATAEYGTPHGLPILLSFIAGVGALEASTFRMVMIAADFGNSLFDDWQMGEVRQLLDWLVAQVEMPPAERLWWLWHISINSEPAQMSRAIAECLLSHKVLLSASKRALCEAWLSDTAAGQPPAQWEAIQALLQGDVAGYKRHVAEAGLPPIPDNELPPVDALTEDFDLALESLAADGDDPDDLEAPALSLNLLRKTLVGPMGMMVLTPGPLKRAAVVALPTLGVDPLVVCQQYLTAKRGDGYGPSLHQGVAEVISAHHTQMSPAEVRALVERGLTIGAMPTRRIYYELGADLYGATFMERALQDNANSIRQWAARKLGKALPKQRGRQPGRG